MKDIRQEDWYKHNSELERSVVGNDTLWQGVEPTTLMITAAVSVLDRLLDRMQLTQVPRRFRQITLRDFSAAVREQAVRALDDDKGVFIYGLVGRGKTGLLAAVKRELKARQAREFLNKRLALLDPGASTKISVVEASVMDSLCEATRRCDDKIVFKEATELMDDIRACFADGARWTKQETIEYYGSVPYLLIDDIGMEKPTEFVREAVDVILNHRWANERWTAFTSNLSLDELETHYDDRGRISSRIAGMCAGGIELRGGDKRSTRGQQ